MKGILLLNGKPPKIKDFLSALKRGEADGRKPAVICADGAYLFFARHNLTPDYVIGDFDSVDIREVSGGNGVSGKTPPLEIIRFNAEKNDTDGRLCVLKATELGVTELEIFGADGKRLDHEYANIGLLKTARGLGVSAKIITADFTVILTDSPVRLKTYAGATLSAVPFGGAAHIKETKGLKYAATDLTLTADACVGVSNVALADEVYIDVDCGEILVFYKERF